MGAVQRASARQKPERLPDRSRFLFMKIALAIGGLLALFGVSVGWAIWGWEQTAGTAMGFHGWLAMILGIVFTIVVGCGLMGLMSTVAGTATMSGQVI